ncbi:PerC transcriptional activator [Klebsiella pneumoniae]|uniref:PerC transcriptional activator n=1 Tax=Klebsiella pneumoniae TaxID=573 RepID=A0A378H4F9_KLEPN|nr:PerC transcriptional activator [Klebsiella pneumoniae]
MSAGHHRGYRPQDDALPADAQALHLETLGLWRRAATRWQQVLLREADDRVAEAVLQRLRYCLAQVAASVSVTAPRRRARRSWRETACRTARICGEWNNQTGGGTP